MGILGELGDAFSYDLGYLARTDAKPLSLSLPLGEREFGPVEIRPYFEGLLAEGQTRAALASQLGLAEEDWLGILVACGGSAPATSSSVILPVCQGRAEMDTSRLTRAS